MNNILTATFYHNTIKNWFISISLVILAFIVGKIVYWISKNILQKGTEKTKYKFDDIIITQLNGPVVTAVVLSGIYLAFERLTFPEIFIKRIGLGYHFAMTLTITWFLVRILNQLIQEYLIPLASKSETTLDDQLLPVIRKGVTAGTWALGLVIALNNAGFNVGALLAGMGIGGLAFAMAAKDTISNFFGGITVFTDKPFKLGDRIKINGFDGFVQEIGLRSTRLKTLEGRIITIPNTKFIDGVVENVTLEPHRKVKLTLGLVYDTTHEQMQRAIDIVHEIMSSDEMTDQEFYTSFYNFNSSSLDILLIYYINKDADILEAKSKVNFKILERFNAEGLSFAFPTTTLDLPKDLKL